MKRKTLKNDSEAVSPVIGVILMVAITVVLAVVVFVLVGKLSHGVSNPPGQLSLTQSRNGQTSVTYTVLMGNEVNYADLIINADGITQTYTHTPNTNTVITAGDTITITGLTTNQQYNFNFVSQNAVIATMTYKS